MLFGMNRLIQIGSRPLGGLGARSTRLGGKVPAESGNLDISELKLRLEVISLRSEGLGARKCRLEFLVELN
jgi:hypothetical protein